MQLAPDLLHPPARAVGDCTEFCVMGFKPMKKHGQDGRATLLDTKFRTARAVGEEGEIWPRLDRSFRWGMLMFSYGCLLESGSGRS